MWSHNRSLYWLTAIILVAGIGHAGAQSRSLVGIAAFGDWRTDKPGLGRLIRPEDLPKSGATPSVANGPHVVPRPPTTITQVPAGFKIELFAQGLSGPREMRVAPNGDIYVAETGPRRIRVLRAADGDSKPSKNEIFASGLNKPFGIAFFPSGDNPQWIYVANTDSVVRFPYRHGDIKASGRSETIVAGLPTGGSHSTRNLVFTDDNKRMFVSVGSRSNDAEGMGSRLTGVLQS
jgi:glucose/arabinose dehydrogenase